MSEGLTDGLTGCEQYQNAGSTEPAWWEAQVWHVWRAREDPGASLAPSSSLC